MKTKPIPRPAAVWMSSGCHIPALDDSPEGRKQQRYCSVEESRWSSGWRVMQRPLLYLGEINDSRQAALRKSISVLEEHTGWG